jgi:hypothetical protein
VLRISFYLFMLRAVFALALFAGAANAASFQYNGNGQITGVTGLSIGKQDTDLTFYDANNGSYQQRFGITEITTATSGVFDYDLAMTVLQAFATFKDANGPIQVNSGNTTLVLPYKSVNGMITYLTTGLGEYRRGIYGPYSGGASSLIFSESVSFLKVRPRLSSGSGAAALAATVPLPMTGLLLLGALGAVGLRARYRRR